MAGGILTAVGVVTLRKTDRKTEIPFAAIPLLFGIQQIIEGIIWLTFHYPAPELNLVMTFIYSLFSHVLWPIYVPFAIVLVETVEWRKKVLWAFWVAGALVSFFLLYFLITLPITSHVMNNIVYVSPHFYLYVVMGFYVAATCVGSMFSSHKLINLFGFLALISFTGAYFFYTVALVSVWCFFAAVLSTIIYLFFRDLHGRSKLPK